MHYSDFTFHICQQSVKDWKETLSASIDSLIQYSRVLHMYIMHLHQYVNAAPPLSNSFIQSTSPAAASLAASVSDKRLPPSKWLPPLSQWGQPQQSRGQQTCPCHQTGQQTALCTNESDTIMGCLIPADNRRHYDSLQIRSAFHFWRNLISKKKKSKKIIKNFVSGSQANK